MEGTDTPRDLEMFVVVVFVVAVTDDDNDVLAGTLGVVATVSEEMRCSVILGLEGGRNATGVPSWEFSVTMDNCSLWGGGGGGGGGRGRRVLVAVNQCQSVCR